MASLISSSHWAEVQGNGRFIVEPVPSDLFRRPRPQGVLILGYLQEQGGLAVLLDVLVESVTDVRLARPPQPHFYGLRGEPIAALGFPLIFEDEPTDVQQRADHRLALAHGPGLTETTRISSAAR